MLITYRFCKRTRHSFYFIADSGICFGCVDALTLNVVWLALWVFAVYSVLVVLGGYRWYS